MSSSRTTVALALTGAAASLSIAPASFHSCYFVDVYSGAEWEVLHGHSYTSPTGKTCTCDFGEFGSCTQILHQNPCQPNPKTEGECLWADPHCYWAPATPAHPVASCIHEYDFGFRDGRFPAVEPPGLQPCAQPQCSPDTEPILMHDMFGGCPVYQCFPKPCPQPYCSYGTEPITIGHNGRCPEYECGLLEFDSNTGFACRGDFPSDNSDDYYDVTYEHNLENCQATCKQRSRCFGVEFNHANQRCELWKRPIGHFKSKSASTCSPMKTQPVPVPSCSTYSSCESCTLSHCVWAFPTFGIRGECIPTDAVCDVQTNPSRNERLDPVPVAALTLAPSVICAKAAGECAADNGGKALRGLDESCTVATNNIFDKCKDGCACVPNHKWADKGTCEGHCAF